MPRPYPYHQAPGYTQPPNGGSTGTRRDVNPGNADGPLLNLPLPSTHLWPEVR